MRALRSAYLAQPYSLVPFHGRRYVIIPPFALLRALLLVVRAASLPDDDTSIVVVMTLPAWLRAVAAVC